MNDIGQILSIRTRRCQSSTARVATAQKQLTARRKGYSTALKVLDAFKGDLAEMERKLLADIVGKKIRPIDIEYIHKTLKDAASSADDLISNVNNAEKAMSQAQDHLKTCQVENKVLTDRKERIETLCDQKAQLQRLAEAEAEEAEAEDIAELIFQHGNRG
ncbi:hypothetical protein [uncultured Tateyamaria sp.]|uniref:hypothetical protein n=1 Tax=uncultured Tateyamaria sp. TaxID=455651 RepID=UPI0026093D40|nr:hypothetical protein [uncultured Tateyamaria sp.]